MTAGSAAAYAVDKPPVKIDRRTEWVGVNGTTSQTVGDSVSVRRQSFDEAAWCPHVETGPYPT